MNSLVQEGRPDNVARETPQRRILVIDDDVALLEDLAEMLRIRFAHVNVETCQSPASAVGLVKRRHYDLILCDVWMPETDGLVLLPKLRQAVPEVPIVMMSGALDGTVPTTALSYGAAAFVTKPFDRDVLTATLRQVLKNNVRRAAV